ncbi:phage integrase central domain-containing protein [Hafnia paralvei]|uniref:phage integrase central domain-containing protein n=1 Tax=Hafnia paralvei TaxID=546367 RepID=UPI003C2F5918
MNWHAEHRRWSAHYATTIQRRLEMYIFPDIGGSLIDQVTTENFTFHDLKAKGISELKGTFSDKQAISGQKNATQTARYDRKTAVVPVVGGQK